jgi:hypothetical protein
MRYVAIICLATIACLAYWLDDGQPSRKPTASASVLPGGRP